MTDCREQAREIFTTVRQPDRETAREAGRGIEAWTADDPLEMYMALQALHNIYADRLLPGCGGRSWRYKRMLAREYIRLCEALVNPEWVGLLDRSDRS